MYKGIIVFQSVADNYIDPKSSNISQTYVMRCRYSRSAKGIISMMLLLNMVNVVSHIYLPHMEHLGCK